MIRTFDIRLNAAHPELPLMEATAIVGSPSTANIYDVPPSVGTWNIAKVFIQVSYPNGSMVTEEASRTAQGIWTATVPMCEMSGRVKSGLVVLADGVDENGEEITGYILGVADFAVYTRGLVVKAGETVYNLRYFDSVPVTPSKGDVAPIDGVPMLYDGYTWLSFAEEVDLSDYYTKEQTDGLLNRSLANYYTKNETDEAIDALAAYYITYNAAGAAFPTKAALLSATTYYSGGVIRTPTRNDYAVVLADETHDGAEYRYIYGVAEGATTGQWEAQYPIETNDYTALSHKPSINSVELSGNKTSADLGLASSAELQSLDNRTADDLGRLYTEWAETQTPDNRANGTIIHFKPSVFGMADGAFLRSVTVRTSDTINNTIPVYLKLIDPADTSTAKAISGPVLMSELDTDYRFTFAEDYPLTATTDYRLVFYVGKENGSAQALVNLRLKVMAAGTDLYFGTNTRWRPIMTAKWPNESITAALGLKADTATVNSLVATILANIAPQFTTTDSYKIGDLCIYKNVLYKCIALHGGGGFGPGHFAEVTIDEALTYCLHYIEDSAGNLTALTIGRRRYTDAPAHVGPNSVVFGSFGEASGANSIAGGYYATATADRAVSLGNHTDAAATDTLAAGAYTQANNEYEVAVGNYNISNTFTHPQGTAIDARTLFSIGGGNSSTRKNALEALQYASASVVKLFLDGVGGYDGTNPNSKGVEDLATVINKKADLYLLKYILDSATLYNQAINYVYPEAGYSYDLDLEFPAAISGKARDFLVVIYRPTGNLGTISFTLPTNARIFGDGFNLAIDEGEHGLYTITEIAANEFLVKGQKIEEVV